MKAHHRGNCVPIVRRSVATRASFAATGENFAVIFATGVEMSATIDTIGATRGETE
jgi:hypothetical protein